MLNGQRTDIQYNQYMQSLRISIASLLVVLSAGCSSTSSQSSAPSFEEQVTEACLQVELGSYQEGPVNSVRDSHFMAAATLFRNLSNQNPAFTDYAEVLNAWATGNYYDKLYTVFDFCGVQY